MSIKQKSPSGEYKSGEFPVSECKKYFGPTPIIFRSSWEYKFILYCERNSKIKRWSSEPLGIRYMGPDHKYHVYYPDFFVEKENGDKLVIEIKPQEQVERPERPKKKSKKAEDRYKRALSRYIIDRCKWRAAHQFCKQNGYKFKLVTEKFFRNAGIEPNS